MEDFAHRAAQSLHDLKQAWTIQDLEQCRWVLHALRGTAADVGATGVVQQCLRTRQVLDAGHRIPDVDAAQQALEQTVKRTQVALADYWRSLS